MHPILAERQRLVLYLASWIPIAGLISGLLVLSGRLSWLAALSIIVPMSIIYAFLCLSAWYLCRIFPVGKTGFKGVLGIFAVAAALSSSLWLLIGKAWILTIQSLPGLGGIWEAYSTHIPLLFVVGVLLFLLAITVHYLMSTFETARQAEKQALELTILAREAELKALKAQVDPHFLFNSLNSISALAIKDPAASRSMCLLLADFLRKSLELGSRDYIPLDEELELVSNYLAIEKVRLGPRLTVRREIGESSRRCLVPPLLLQPIMENAVRHGIAPILEGGEIQIFAERRSGRLEIRVENPCDSDPGARLSTGIGLANVRSRLHAACGNEAGLDLVRHDSRFRATITLPAVEKGDRGNLTGVGRLERG